MSASFHTHHHSSKPIRRSVLWYQEQYEKGASSNNFELQKPLKDLLVAWEGIKAKSATIQDSFFNIASFHGASFDKPTIPRIPPEKDSIYWGGYCNHGNILFPTWHRLYVREVEKALQEIIPHVTMPFWDETNAHSLRNGIPWVLTRIYIEFVDGDTIKNPLVSFTIPAKITVNQDDINNNEGLNYTKEIGYKTVRYPYSGLSTPDAIIHNEKINKDYDTPEKVAEVLNKNIVQWLTGTLPRRTKDEPVPTPYDPSNPTSADGYCIDTLFKKSVLVDNYVIFSNTSSAAAYNSKYTGKRLTVSLEQPHNDVHLSVGGFTLFYNESDGTPNYQIDGIIEGANGDMGENETAAYDPIFFFHHCNIDRVFWLWQVKHGRITKESLQKDYDNFVNEYVTSSDPITPKLGLSTTDLQGPTPTFPWGEKLNYTTPLVPFRKLSGEYYNSNDVWNIADLDYSYEDGSLIHESIENLTLNDSIVKKALQIDIQRGSIPGSVLVQAFIKDGSSNWVYIGHSSILSRQVITACPNCLNTLSVNTFFQLPDDLVNFYNNHSINTIEVKIIIKTRQEDIINVYNIPLNELINNNSNIQTTFTSPLTNVKII